MCPEGWVGCLQDDGHIVEARVVHETGKEGLADGTVAQCLVPVHMGGNSFLAVVEMDGFEVVGADDAVELVEGWIELPDDVTEIPGDAFCETGLTSIEIPASVTEIKEETFECCSQPTVCFFSYFCALFEK